MYVILVDLIPLKHFFNPANRADKLPIIFVCENNLYSVYTSLKDRQPNRSPKKLGEAHNIKSYMCDGNDVLKVFVSFMTWTKNFKMLSVWYLNDITFYKIFKGKN